MVTIADYWCDLEKRRRQLGMSRAVVARRSGLSLPTVTRLLTGKDSNPRLRTIEAIAAALGTSLRFVPEDVDTMRERRAEQKARRLVGLVQGTMGLESQAIGPEALERMVRRTSQKLLAGSSRALWDD